MTKEPDKHAKIPTKHEDGVQPIITQTDVLKYPIFLVTEAPEEFDGAFPILGKTKVKITSPKLGANEADVFHALVHLGKQQDFHDMEIEFITRQLLQLMKWGNSGAEYKRLKKAITNLCDVKVEIEGEQFWTLVQFFHSPMLWHNEQNPDQEALFKSSISMGKQLFRMCTAGRLKEIHPYYFNLRARTAKRIFELISGRASDLKFWQINLFELRDLIPLIGKKYQTLSGVKQSIEPTLKQFKKDNILFGYEFRPIAGQKAEYLCLHINNDYFYSQAFPTRKIALQPKAKEIAAQQNSDAATPPENDVFCIALVERGVTAKTAVALIQKYGQDRAAFQIEHFDFLLEQAKAGKQGRAPEGGAWLVHAIEQNWKPPLDFKTKAAREMEARISDFIKGAQDAFERRDYKTAAKLAEECLKLGPNSKAEKIFKDSEKESRNVEEEERVGAFMKEMPPEQLAEFEKKTEESLKNLGSFALDEYKRNGKNSRFFRAILKQTIKKAFLSTQ